MCLCSYITLLVLAFLPFSSCSRVSRSCNVTPNFITNFTFNNSVIAIYSYLKARLQITSRLISHNITNNLNKILAYLLISQKCEHMLQIISTIYFFHTACIPKFQQIIKDVVYFGHSDFPCHKRRAIVTKAANYFNNPSISSCLHRWIPLAIHRSFQNIVNRDHFSLLQSQYGQQVAMKWHRISQTSLKFSVNQIM